jgi:hypothetical protein
VEEYILRVRFYDLGDSPSLTLLGVAVTFGVIWAISYWIEEQDIPVVSIIACIIGKIVKIGCVGCLISIPLNFILGL